MTTKILFREDKHTHDEYNACLKYFPSTIRYRHQIAKNDLIIGRYSVLPFYKELDEEISCLGGELINTFEQHQYIANMKDWVCDLEGLTPKTWMLSDLFNGYMSISETEHGYFIKGATNSKKFMWNTHARAKTKINIGPVISKLQEDLFLLGQDIAIREFIPLKVLEVGIADLPMSNEWRFFFLKDQLIDYGFYWSIIENISEVRLCDEAIDLAKKASKIISQKTNAYVIDVAETFGGDWIVIEVNDLQMSGLSTIPPERFYKNLSKINHAITSSV